VTHDDGSARQKQELNRTGPKTHGTRAHLGLRDAEFLITLLWSGGISNLLQMERDWSRDVTVLGGCGHVGLPLGLALADSGLRVALFDTNDTAVRLVQSGTMPHREAGAQEVLERTLASGRLTATSDPTSVGSAECLIVVVGTPVDEHLNPDPQAVITAIESVGEHLLDGQLIVLRSTIFPGVTRMVERLVDRTGKDIDVAFCPERIAEGRAMEELHSLPQIVSARTVRGSERASDLFGNIARSIIHVKPEEAELAKLFTNSYRYIKFAAANQLFMMANDFGVDYEQVRMAVVHDYPRAADLPGPGFAAGPCLLKDTMQLAAFNNNNFALGMASMQINEGLPLYLVSRMATKYELEDMTVGILGMAFKGESDDARNSLSYKLKRVLKVRASRVLTTDPYVNGDPSLVSLEEVLTQADLIVIGAPHELYAKSQIRQPVVDVWNLRGEGVLV
jgi:UDP-N-acetyl-D-mannosaminuronic acid dehydrogenase